MKKILVILALIVFVGLAAYFFFSGDEADPDTYTDLGGVTPPDGSGRTPGTSPSGGEKLLISTEAGDVVINDVRTFPATEKLGDSLYRLKDAGDEEFFPAYNVVFSEANGSLAVSLNQEPFAETRLAAEEFIGRMLGIAQNDMCKLTVYVGVPFDVDPELSGTNLGFSFCPGSVTLP